MSMTEIVKLFGEHKIRSIWDDEAEEWYFSVVDVVAVLTETRSAQLLESAQKPPKKGRKSNGYKL